MIPSKPVFVELALLPSRFAIAVPMSMSEPAGFEPRRTPRADR